MIQSFEVAAAQPTPLGEPRKLMSAAELNSLKRAEDVLEHNV
jgi:hypothetical protein